MVEKSHQENPEHSSPWKDFNVSEEHYETIFSEVDNENTEVEENHKPLPDALLQLFENKDDAIRAQMLQVILAEKDPIEQLGILRQRLEDDLHTGPSDLGWDFKVTNEHYEEIYSNMDRTIEEAVEKNKDVPGLFLMLFEKKDDALRAWILYRLNFEEVTLPDFVDHDTDASNLWVEFSVPKKHYAQIYSDTTTAIQNATKDRKGRPDLFIELFEDKDDAIRAWIIHELDGDKANSDEFFDYEYEIDSDHPGTWEDLKTTEEHYKEIYFEMADKIDQELEEREISEAKRDDTDISLSLMDIILKVFENKDAAIRAWILLEQR